MNSEASEQLKSLLVNTKAYDRNKRHVYFDRVWHQPDGLRQCAEIVCEYLQYKQLLPDDISKLVILSPDTVRSNFGIIPVSVLVADKLGCHVAVWKELADVRWGTSDILGTKATGLICIALQDVVRRGHTSLQIAYGLQALNWKFIHYVGAVLNNEEGAGPATETMEKIEPILGESPRFSYIVSAQEL